MTALSAVFPQGIWTLLLHLTTVSVSFPVLNSFHILFILESGLTEQEAVRQFIPTLYFTIASSRKEIL